jgi:hypothetical protein
MDQISDHNFGISQKYHVSKVYWGERVDCGWEMIRRRRVIYHPQSTFGPSDRRATAWSDASVCASGLIRNPLVPAAALRNGGDARYRLARSGLRF